MKIISNILIAIVASLFSLCSQAILKSEKKGIDFKTIRKEIEWFIEKVKPKSYMQGKHNVYIVKIYEEDIDEEFCFTIGYIDNPLLFKYIKEFKYFTHIKEDLIILDYTNDFKQRHILKNAESIKLLIDKQIITDKLDMEMEAIGTWPGYVCCYEKGKMKKVFYENSDEIPSEKSIFNIPLPEPGSIIEIDSSTFKQMLKDTKKKSIK